MAKHKLMSERKRRICELDAESIAFYRRNPCIACEDLLGIKLTDAQKYLLQGSWNSSHVLWCCSRDFGKSFLGAVFMILKAILYENQAIYIVSSVGDQSKETFTKIEEIVLRIGKTSASIDSLQDIVEKETVKSANNKTGFSHAQTGFHVSFYNGSEIFTLNGNPDNNRSKLNYNIFIIKNKSIRRKLIMNPRWTENEIKFLKDNYYSISLDEISKQLQRDKSAIKTKACKLKITNNNEWSDAEIEYLKNNYQTKTYKELSKELVGRTKTAIDLKINRLGLKKSIYTYNHDFFEFIDTEEKAYWLGFMYADGCVYINNITNSGEVCIKLFKGDYNHLKKFNKSLNGNVPVTFEERICTFNNKKQESCVIRCYSIKMANDLISHGCIPNKTFNIKVPKINESLMKHFIRGFFDGDGCICTDSSKRKTVAINFCSASKEFLMDIREHLYKVDICSYITDEKGSTYRLYIRGMKNTDKMWNYMFDNATIYLDRKLSKKEKLYKEYQIAQRLLRQSEMAG